MKTFWFIGADVWPGVSKLIEEAGEVLQVCGKLMGNGGERKHWNRDDLFEAFADEVGDLLAAIDFVLIHAPTGVKERIHVRRQVKLTTFRRWHAEGHGGRAMKDAVEELPTRFVPCMGCSRAAMAAETGFEWPCEGHDEGSTMAWLERDRSAETSK